MPNLLIVEDDASTRRMLETELTANGYQVTLAVDGLDALMQLEKQAPDAILCDIHLPNLDGLAFTQAIKANPATRNIPVLILTADSDPRKMIDGINVGARFYLTKPFEMKELLRKLQRLISGNGERTRSAP